MRGGVIIIKDQFLNSFLKDIKKKVAKRQYILADREKNNNFLRDRGLNLEHVREAILRLSDKDKPIVSRGRQRWISWICV